MNNQVKYDQQRFTKKMRRIERMRLAGNIATLLFATVGALFLIWAVVSFVWVIAFNLGPAADCPSWNLFNIITKDGI